MDKAKFLGVCVLSLASMLFCLQNKDLASAVNTYDFEYGPDGFSAMSRESGEKKYFPRGNVKMNGIDISSWSGDIDCGKLKESGVEFVMIREGYGQPNPRQVDKRFRRNIKSLQEAGIPCGIYHYSYAKTVDEVIREAEFCIENIRDYKLEFPVVFDIEDKSVECCGRRVTTDMCNTFCRKISEAGYYPAVYTNKNWLENFLYSSEIQPRYDLWFAHWKDMSDPDYWCGIWQRLNDQKIDGVEWSADLNICYYPYPDIMKELHINGY